MKFLIDFTNLPCSNKHYGGNAGLKRGVIIDDKNLLLKFPQEASTFDNVTILFTTSPLSAYVGSHIYQLLRYTAHNTMLGYYFKKDTYNEKFFNNNNIIIFYDRQILDVLRSKSIIRIMFNDKSFNVYANFLILEFDKSELSIDDYILSWYKS